MDYKIYEIEYRYIKKIKLNLNIIFNIKSPVPVQFKGYVLK